ncbi:hypothetical protein SAMN05216388_1003246 [Halorientalis persicus]|uniref:PGF-CTERM protein n=1 Tax=Halorientalis persicus TaxID=1367881 RepID=A0A1H8H0V2_9EURY|nr:hypothetical protein [Halorientalis persicus]SEN49387.1 hypothetical protein SAMN05216388_1003246 [Halorientalis persicus]
MVRGRWAGGDIVTNRYENGTVELSTTPAMRCLAADLTLAFQRLDTGRTATAIITATVEQEAGGDLHSRNYTVARGAVLPVTLTRECHELTLELDRTDPNASASITLAEDEPIERNETLWLDTTHAGNASGLFRSEAGTVTRNATTNVSDGALAPGTYRLRATFGRYELDTATLSVTNRSSGHSPTEPTPEFPETPQSTPNTIVPPPTDTPTTHRPTTTATPSNRTAAGNAHRPAGTDPFGTTAATTDASGPGFGPVLAALAVAVLAVLAVHRTGD